MSASVLRRVLLGATMVALAAVLLAVAVPRVSRSSWDDLAEAVPQISFRALALMVFLWIVGLYAHTVLLTSVLPDLRRRDAFALNLGGSCVSNVVPLGGAAGVALNWAMLSSWGFDRSEVLTFTATTNVIVAVVKVGVAIAGLVVLVSVPDLRAAVPHAGVVLLVTVATALVLAVGALVACRRALRRDARGRAAPIGALIDRVRAVGRSAVAAVRTRWLPVTFGALAYPLLQLALLAACVHAFGVHLSVLRLAVAYAADRILTLVPLTPGGAGVAETGMTAVLIAFGADPAASATAVLLYRGFTYYIEIPLGAVVALAWAARRDGRQAA